VLWDHDNGEPCETTKATRPEPADAVALAGVVFHGLVFSAVDVGALEQMDPVAVQSRLLIRLLRQA